MSKKMKLRKTICFSDGTRAEIKGENARYWLCAKAQFRKSNPRIVAVEVERLKDEKDEEQEEEVK